MTTAQLDHLRAIDAHLERLLQIAKKRTPGRWKSVFPPTSNGFWYCEAGDEQIAVCYYTNAQSESAFITSCAGNAEAGWGMARSTVEQLISMRKDTTCWDFVGKPLMKAILNQWPLELLEA